MELPWQCRVCQQEMMIDLNTLQEESKDKIISAKGFRCENCGSWQTVTYTSLSLKEQMKVLRRYHPGHPKFKFLFSKTLRKAEGVYRRGERLYG